MSDYEIWEKRYNKRLLWHRSRELTSICYYKNLVQIREWKIVKSATQFRQFQIVFYYWIQMYENPNNFLGYVFVNQRFWICENRPTGLSCCSLKNTLTTVEKKSKNCLVYSAFGVLASSRLRHIFSLWLKEKQNINTYSVTA